MWSGIQNWIRPFRSKSSASPPTSTLPRSVQQLKRFSKSTMGAKGAHRVNTTQRLANLREQLRQHSVQAFVNSQMVSVPNLVDKVWHDRPTRPKNPVLHLDVKYSDKIEAVRKEMKKKETNAIVITMFDEVAWLFNLRGSDIDFDPAHTRGLQR